MSRKHRKVHPTNPQDAREETPPAQMTALETAQERTERTIRKTKYALSLLSIFSLAASYAAFYFPFANKNKSEEEMLKTIKDTYFYFNLMQVFLSCINKYAARNNYLKNSEELKDFQSTIKSLQDCKNLSKVEKAEKTSEALDKLLRTAIEEERASELGKILEQAIEDNTTQELQKKHTRFENIIEDFFILNFIFRNKMQQQHDPKDSVANESLDKYLACFANLKTTATRDLLYNSSGILPQLVFLGIRTAYTLFDYLSSKNSVKENDLKDIGGFGIALYIFMVFLSKLTRKGISRINTESYFKKGANCISSLISLISSALFVNQDSVEQHSRTVIATKIAQISQLILKKYGPLHRIPMYSLPTMAEFMETMHINLNPHDTKSNGENNGLIQRRTELCNLLYSNFQGSFKELGMAMYENIHEQNSATKVCPNHASKTESTEGINDTEAPASINTALAGSTTNENNLEMTASHAPAFCAIGSSSFETTKTLRATNVSDIAIGFPGIANDTTSDSETYTMTASMPSATTYSAQLATAASSSSTRDAGISSLSEGSRSSGNMTYTESSSARSKMEPSAPMPASVTM